MKRFLICSLIAALPLIDASACISEGATHNRYMFSVYRHNALTDGPAFLYDIDRYWQTYTGNDGTSGVGFYKWNRDEIMSTARKKNDTAMIAYLTLFNRYIKTCEAYTEDAWNYPTKQEMAQRQKTLREVLAATKAYRGTALRPQYVLLQMRANMMLGYNKANIALWNSTASRLAQSVWREAMRNIYARALLKNGQRTRACNIYAEQGDVQSIKTVMRNFRNLAGIRTIFAQNPNAPTLHFLVQDFVNNVQETLDQKAAGIDDAEWFKTIDAKQVYRKDAMAFVQFAVDAAANAKVKSPSLWLAAASMVDYLMGNNQRAIAEADKAVEADGTERMRDNARAIRLLVSTRSNKPTAEYTDFLLGEFRWLDVKIKEEGGTESGYGNHYADVKDRVVHRGLEPLFRKAGMDNTALALCAMMNAEGNHNNVSYGPWNEYFCKMDSLKADRLADYYQYLSTPHTNAFETYCTQNTYHDADYFNDLIGTKLIAEGRFADAIPYLKKVGMSLLSTQMISIYSSQRHYDTPRWFGKQRVDEAYEPAKVTRNAKLDFCMDMTDRLSRYNLAREGSYRQQMAYDLAVRYYQASCYGDCWFLTHYYHSVMDSARSWEKDFAAETVKYLNIAKQSDDVQLRYRSLYALAFMPVEPWATVEYDDVSNGYKEMLIVHPKSAQYMALSDLDMFAKAYPNAIDDYTRRCDVLQEFRLKRESQNF